MRKNQKCTVVVILSGAKNLEFPKKRDERPFTEFTCPTCGSVGTKTGTRFLGRYCSLRMTGEGFRVTQA
jgi:hypothetical protein